MNTTLTLIQNANSLNIDIPKLLTYMSIVLKNSDMEPDKTIKDFSKLLKRITKIWANDDSEDWNNIKSISEKHEISLADIYGNWKPFSTVLVDLLYTHYSLSVFCKSELITALAGEGNRNILLTLVENYKKKKDVGAINMIATAMLDDVYNNQNGGGLTMDSDKITTMAAALEAVGIKTQQDGEYRPFDAVMGELYEKWHSLDQAAKQKVGSAFVRSMMV